jgi:glucosylceramidase
MVRSISSSSFRLCSLSSVGFVFVALGCGTSSPSALAGLAGAAALGGNSGEGGTGVASSAAGSNHAGTSNGGDGSNSAGRADGGGGSSAGASGSQAGAAGISGSLGSGGSAPAVRLPPLVTSAPGAYWKTDGAFSESTASTADVTVNDSVVGQKWQGFGAAFNEQGWAVLTSIELQQRAMNLLFSVSDGAAFTWGRIPIGANDYALSRYTEDDTGEDVAPDSGETNRPPADTTLSMFSLARDDEKLVPYVKAAQAVKPDLRFWASPWTPPVWMKTSLRKTDGWTDVKKPSYFDGGSMRSDVSILSAYARYFAKFVQGYRERGIEIELVAPQEEPSFELSYPSCLWDQATYVKFVGQFLGPEMKGIGVDVMLGALSDADKDFTIATAVLADNTAKNFSTVVGAQWGLLSWDIRITKLGTTLPIWATEHQGGNYPWNPSEFPPYQSIAPNDHAYGVESWTRIRDAILKAKVSSYNAWNLVLDKYGWSIDTTREWAQNALLVADSGTLTATPAYYVFRHLSQYVAPGAVVLGTTGGDALAFKNPDGTLVAVLFNRGPANDHYVVAIGGKQVQFAMPSNGWATLKLEP